MKLLRLIASIDPRSGGPAEAAFAMDRELFALGHTVHTVTLDPAGAEYIRNYPLPVTALGPTRLNYGYSSRLLAWLKAEGGNYDAAIVDGIWQFPTWAARLVLPRLKVPYFVFAHGMLDPWFNKAYPAKYIKKLVYWFLMERKNLNQARAIVFTCEEEKIQALHSFPAFSPSPLVTSFGTTRPPGDPEGRLRETFLAAYPELRGKNLLLYLSRIDKKKGCDLLLEAFAKVAPKNPSLHLVMAGPDNSGWSKELRSTYAALEAEGRVTWTGMLSGDMKWGAFHACDAFCLPSHQENFGIVVAEALGCGKPVLISNKVNIWREIQQDGAALVADDTSDDTVRMLTAWTSLSDDQRHRMQAEAGRCFSRRYEVASAAADLAGKIEAARHDARAARP